MCPDITADAVSPNKAKAELMRTAFTLVAFSSDCMYMKEKIGL